MVPAASSFCLGVSAERLFALATQISRSTGLQGLGTNHSSRKGADSLLAPRGLKSTHGKAIPIKASIWHNIFSSLDRRKEALSRNGQAFHQGFAYNIVYTRAGRVPKDRGPKCILSMLPRFGFGILTIPCPFELQATESRWGTSSCRCKTVEKMASSSDSLRYLD